MPQYNPQTGECLCGCPGKPPCPRETLRNDVNKATGIQFDTEAANRLFEVNPSEVNKQIKNDINFGKFKGRNFFTTQDQGANVVISPTNMNPQNAQGFSSQIKELRKLNPDIEIDDRFLQFSDRFPDGGTTGECGGPGQPPCLDQLTKDVNAATGVQFEPDAANKLFEGNTPELGSPKTNQLDFGKYEGRNFFTVKDQGDNVIIQPTNDNPQNAAGFLRQVRELKALNPNVVLDDVYIQFRNRS